MGWQCGEGLSPAALLPMFGDSKLRWSGADFGSCNYYYSSDALGSTRVLTSSTGAVQDTDTYDPYGNPNAWSGLSYRYTGQLMIPEAHLRREYRRRVRRYLKHTWNPGMVFTYMVKIAMHYHAHTMATQMKSGATKVYNSY